MMLPFQDQMMFFMYTWRDLKDLSYFVYMEAVIQDFLAHSYAEVHFIINILKIKQNALPPSLKWCIASEIKEKTRAVAMDLRGHGKSSTDNDLDLSVETLLNDVVVVLKTLYGDSPPAIVLVGHSMGGSVAVHVAIKKVIPSLADLIVVDVVEIEWSVKGGSLRNVESALVSVPPTLKYNDAKKCYTYRTRLEETEQYWKAGMKVFLRSFY